MDKYYHFTSYNCFYNIMREGLIPQTGFRCQTIGDNSYGVFLSKGIDKSIIMYAYMLSFYEKYNGLEGAKVIEESLKRIQELNQTRKFGIKNFFNENEIRECNQAIQRVMQIRSCGNFINYLGGYGCFLSISGINQINDFVPEDCCYKEIIPPSNINVVNIRNKYTNEYINYIGPVLSYFMYLYPVEKVVKNLDEENKKCIYNLYNYRDNSWCVGYNLENFDLVEVPIQYYDFNIQTNKTLIKY